MKEVAVIGCKAIIVKDGAIASSVTNLMDCVRVVVKEMGIPFAMALHCATFNPACEIGIDKEYGTIEIGKHADFLLLDDELDLQAVYKQERKITI